MMQNVHVKLNPGFPWQKQEEGGGGGGGGEEGEEGGEEGDGGGGGGGGGREEGEEEKEEEEEKKKKKKKNFSSKWALNLRGQKLVNCYLKSRALYHAATWTLRKVD
jgi:hypothetical protein